MIIHHHYKMLCKQITLCVPTRIIISQNFNEMLQANEVKEAVLTIPYEYDIIDIKKIDSLTETLLKLIDEKIKEYKQDDKIDLNEELSISIFKNSINSQISKLDPLIILKEKEVIELVNLVGTLQNRKMILTQKSHINNIEKGILELKKEKKQLQSKIKDLERSLKGTYTLQEEYFDNVTHFQIDCKYLISELEIEELFFKLMKNIVPSCKKFNELTLLKFKYKTLKSDKRKDIISQIDFKREMNIFMVSCIDFIDELNKEDLEIISCE